jgi:hypothetical protein
MEEKKNIITLDFSTANIPQPYESKNTSEQTFVNWGINNLYPNFLLELYGSSAVHSAIINQKTTYLIGNGIRVNDNEVSDTVMVNSSDSFKEFISKLIKDYLIFNAFSVEVVFNVFGEPIEFHHIPLHKIRMNKSKTKFYFCDDWFYKRKNITYERYYPKTNKDGISKVFYFDGYFPSISNVYPTPEYNASIKSIVTDSAISEFNLNNIKNHFSPSNIITFFNGSNVTEVVKRQITDDINEKFRGESGKKFIIDFQHKDGKSAEIQQLSATDWDKAYIEVNSRNIENIMIGHEVQNPSLFGIKTAGQLGSSTELEASYEMFKNNYISVKRGEIIMGLNQLFFKFKTISGNISFVDKPLFKNTISDGTREKIYTIDELRTLDGSEPLPNGLGNRMIGEAIIDIPVQNKVQDTSSITELNINQPAQNEALKNLTGRQYQNVMRIVRQFTNGKLTKSQATLMLQNGFGFSVNDVEIFLTVDETPITETEILEFSEVKKKVNSRILGEDDYNLISHLGTENINFEFVDELAELKFDREGDISNYLIEKELKGLTAKQISQKITENTRYTISESEVKEYLNKLQDGGLITYKTTPDGNVSITKNTKIPPTVKTNTILTLYKYVKRDDVPGDTLIKTSRAFCVKLINNNKLYSREEIQTMSSIFGYDVFKYSGGFYHNPITDETTTHCRHMWQPVRVKRK